MAGIFALTVLCRCSKCFYMPAGKMTPDAVVCFARSRNGVILRAVHSHLRTGGGPAGYGWRLKNVAEPDETEPVVIRGTHGRKHPFRSSLDGVVPLR